MGKVRQRVLDLPGEIQNLIFLSPAYTEYFDRWIQRMMLITNGKNFEYKKVFGIKTLRVFEPHCEFPGLIYVPDKEYGLSRQLWNGDWDHFEIGCPELGAQLFEEGFLSYYPVKHLEELHDFPNIVRNTVKSIQDEHLRRRLNTNSPIILRIWSTVPEFDPSNFMEVKPAKHCILINPSVSDYAAELRMGRIPLKFEDPLSIMNLWRIVKKGFMMNAVQEIRNRPVLAKNNRIIIFGEDMYVLGIWGKRLKVSNYRNSNGQWWSKTDKDPKDLIDHNQFSGSDGTWHLDYCTTCEEWGHNDCDFVEDGVWGSPTHYDPYDDEYVDDD